MFTSTIRKSEKQRRVNLKLEELESRFVPSAVQPQPILETVLSNNWSGYAALTKLNAPATNSVTGASGNWIVPNVTGNTNAYSSIWVGIDGFSSKSVEQLGTEQDTTRTGATRYYAWWEMYPNPSVLISGMKISPNDSIMASVTASGNSFTLSMKDNTTGQTFTTTQTSTTAKKSSAEWIVEAPSSFSGILPLANFGTANISGAQATINGTKGAIDGSAWQNTAIDMVNKSGSVIAHTSGLTDMSSTSSFSVTFTGSTGGHGHGHGSMHTLNLGVPAPSFFLSTATPEVKPNTIDRSSATSAGQDRMVSASVVDAWSPGFAHVTEQGSTSELKTWWDSMQSATADDGLRLDIQGSEGLDQSL